MKASILAYTESVCPVCLQAVPARRILAGDDIYLWKRCPEHGEFKTIAWRGFESYRRWEARGSRAATPPVAETPLRHGCPHDCGLCPDHRQHSCCVLLEVTQRCNLNCPVCFADASRDGDDPSLAEIDGWLDRLREHGSPVNIQLSGGEPTVRDDLPAIVRRVRARGFDFVQVNTNGLRLAKEAGYAQSLAEAGLDCVFLQFDGVEDATYRRIRGANLLTIKKTAILRCADAGLAVVLVPTLVPGVNVGEIGAIIDFALARVPVVRAVHFQPISYFGRYPEAPADDQRITLPEVMAEIERQTAGRVRLADFGPGASENVFCSFVGKFEVSGDGCLRSTRAATECGTGDAKCGCGCGTPVDDDDGPRSRRIVARQWAGDLKRQATASPAAAGLASFDAFLASRGHSFTLSGMAFQDAWNLDLERLRECFIHIVSPDRRVIPFCAYNLTSASGEPLYRHPFHELALA
jgi:uncharacterized radical SAM superfamily Fe-S cluster-containing enzyme